MNTDTDRVKLHETATHEFYQTRGGSVWQLNKISGRTARIRSINTLLLLDIARSLLDIKLWGIAQEKDFGQRTHTS